MAHTAAGGEAPEEETSFLPVAIDELVEALVELTNPDKGDDFRGMVSGLRVVVGVYYDNIAQRIRAGIDGGMRTQEECNAFIADVLRLLSAAQYSFIDESTFDDAMEGQYSFNFPTEIKWEHLDDTVLRSYFKKEMHLVKPSVPAPPYSSTALPVFAERMMIFTRGRGKVSATDYMITEKLNLVCQVFSAKVKALFSREKAAGGAAGGGSKAGKARHADAVKSRVSLESRCKESGILNLMFSKLTVQEPTFENAILVYWPQPTAPTVVPVSRDVPADSNQKKVQGGLRRRKGSPEASDGAQSTTPNRPGVVVSLFVNVPFGDLEGVFPFKEVFLRPFDFLQVAIYAVMGLMVVYATLEGLTDEEQNGGNLVLLQLLLVAMARQCSVLYTYYTNLRDCYMREVHEWEQRHNHAQGMSVMSQLVDDVKAQELKELIVAYFFLWVHGPSSASDVDRRSEDFLRSRFGLELNFDVADAVAKLLSLRLIAQDSQGRYLITMTPAEWTQKVPTAHLHEFNLKADD